MPEHTVFVVWDDSVGRVYGVFVQWESASEYLERLLREPKAPDAFPRLTTVFPDEAMQLFKDPLKCMRALENRRLPAPSAKTVYESELERWLWGNTRTRTNLAEYLDAVGDADSASSDQDDELRICRRALKFAAARLLAGIVD
ncbi:MAG: hypothetical protein EOO40_00595 [Deltaproteobacteria bacterium]|nr:MAG: hypothetical protein EOO40_00595 [Deltaproteobacteria bacterium]